MSEPLWHRSESPVTLLNLLEERGDERRLRLLGCVFFRLLLNTDFGRALLGEERTRQSATGWPALLSLAETVADQPDNSTARRGLRLLRTQLAVDSQALSRLMLNPTSWAPPPPPGPPQVEILPRLLVMAMASRFFNPPSPLAEVPLASEIIGELLQPGISLMRDGYPVAQAEERYLTRLREMTGPYTSIQAVLEALIVFEAGLLLGAEGGPGPEPTLQHVLMDLRMEIPDEIAPLLQTTNDLGLPDLHDLLLLWARAGNDLESHPIAGSIAFLQACGLAYIATSVWTVQMDSPSVPGFRATQRGLAETIRRVIGNPYQPWRCDPLWIRRDDQRVGNLAEAIYQRRSWADFPILADALEDAGCPERAILDALRQAPVPFRGWWLLDALRLPL